MIEIKCQTGIDAELKEIKPLQGDLKKLSDENYHKLKQQIIDEGFIAPFLVWKKDGFFYLLDGHQRYFTINKLKETGIEMPLRWPIVPVEAKNYKEACKRILAISSQYGTMTLEGLKKFSKEAGISDQEVFEEFEFDVIDFNKWDEEEFNPEAGSLDDQDNLTDRKEKMFKCPDCGTITNLRDHGF